jgi:effector protein B
MKDLLLVIIPSLVTALITWFASKRKYKTEADSSEIDNVSKIIGIYRESIEDFKKQIEELRVKVDIVVQENEELGRKIEILTKELSCTRAENKRLITELKKYNSQLNEKTDQS